MKRPSILAGLALGAASLATAGPAAAQQAMPGACAPVVGTFLTLKSDDPTIPADDVGRSLLSLTAGGLAFMADSAQGGDDRFQPFSAAAGEWTCAGRADGAVALRATVVDFTFPTDSMPDQQMARVDIEARYDTGSGTLSGAATVSFFPIDGDPLDSSTATATTGYDFTGRRVAAR